MGRSPRPDEPAINGKFGLTTPFDWLAKLIFDVRHLEQCFPGETLDRIYHTMNFVVSAWQMCDWVWEASDATTRERWAMELTGIATECVAGRKDFRAMVKGRSVYMRVCAAVANELKHYSASSEATDDMLVDSWSTGCHRIEGDESSPLDWRAQFRFHDELLSDVDVCRGALGFWTLSLFNVGMLPREAAEMAIAKINKGK